MSRPSTTHGIKCENTYGWWLDTGRPSFRLKLVWVLRLYVEIIGATVHFTTRGIMCWSLWIDFKYSKYSSQYSNSEWSRITRYVMKRDVSFHMRNDCIVKNCIWQVDVYSTHNLWLIMTWLSYSWHPWKWQELLWVFWYKRYYRIGDFCQRSTP